MARTNRKGDACLNDSICLLDHAMNTIICFEVGLEYKPGVFAADEVINCTIQNNRQFVQLRTNRFPGIVESLPSVEHAQFG